MGDYFNQNLSQNLSFYFLYTICVNMWKVFDFPFLFYGKNKLTTYAASSFHSWQEIIL